MKGDFSRLPFHSDIETKHYGAVLDQQGRVKTDYDKAVEVAIESHLRQSALRDIIGRSGAPADNPGFQLSRTPQGDLMIGAGHYYVDGILCVNDRAVSFTEQPDLPGQELPEAAGRYLAYLRAFERHITAIEDPDIREVALGGPDTTTRTRTVCGVRLFEVGRDAHCLSSLPEWEETISPGDGQLSARARRSEDTGDPCLVAPDAGFTGLENQLYRIEIRRGGDPGESTFLWDRDNGCIAFPIEEFLDGQPTTRLRLGSLGRSDVRSLNAGDLLEITDDIQELNGEPGLLLRVEAVEPSVGIITVDGQVDGLSRDHHPKVRRWSGGEEIPVSVGDFIPLEDGVEVSFSGTRFEAGAHWAVAARTATGDVIWPTQDGEPVPQPPLGIKYRHERLALIDFGAGGFDIASDCRKIFPPLSHSVLRIRRVETADSQVLPHDGTIRATSLVRGLDIQFSAPLSEQALAVLATQQFINPVVFLELLLPEPHDAEGRAFWGLQPDEFFGFHPVVLAGVVTLQANRSDRLHWQPSDPTRRWLERVFARLVPPNANEPIVERLLCTLRVRAGYLWADGPDGTRIFLDGETTANPGVRAGVDLPSGDGKPGGSFALSFWLVAPNVQLPLVLSASVSLNVVSGTVSRGGEGVDAATVRLRRNNPPGAGSEQRTRSDADGQFSFTALAGEYTVIAESLGDTAEQNVEVGPVIVAPGGGGGGPAGPGDLSVREIDGIGPVFNGLLTANGVRRVSEFVSLPPERIAQILSVSVERARNLLVSARRLLEE